MESVEFVDPCREVEDVARPIDVDGLGGRALNHEVIDGCEVVNLDRLGLEIVVPVVEPEVGFGDVALDEFDTILDVRPGIGRTHAGVRRAVRGEVGAALLCARAVLRLDETRHCGVGVVAGEQPLN